MRARARALAANEVAVGGRHAAFAGRHAIAVDREAHRAARLAPLEARFLEDAVEPLGLGLALDGLGAWHDPGRDARRHLAALRQGSGLLDVGEATVGAGADEHPVDVRAGALGAPL